MNPAADSGFYIFSLLMCRRESQQIKTYFAPQHFVHLWLPNKLFGRGREDISVDQLKCSKFPSDLWLQEVMTLGSSSFSSAELLASTSVFVVTNDIREPIGSCTCLLDARFEAHWCRIKSIWLRSDPFGKMRGHCSFVRMQDVRTLHRHAKV